jgi:hypothetical protein
LRRHRRRHVEHPYSLARQADLLQPRLQVFDPSFRCGITFQVMTISRQSAGDHHPIHTALKSLKETQIVDTPTAGQQDNLGLRRILHAQPASQIGGCVGAMLAAQGKDFQL